MAAGSGRRFGERKQFEGLGGVRVLDWSLRTARDLTDGVVVVVPGDVAGDDEPLADVVVAGGATRSASVRAGLAAVPSDATAVLVHDAARPVPVPAVWRRVRATLDRGADAAIPVVEIADTLRRVVDGATVDRAGLVAVQTPQGFRVDVLRRAHDGCPEATDDASLVEAAGAAVVMVHGDRANIKTTDAADRTIAERLCR
ncbi:2-C-methyl-D-erythritol 4-phosphate cytidylyltransferase [soil metagenome]